MFFRGITLFLFLFLKFVSEESESGKMDENAEIRIEIRENSKELFLVLANLFSFVLFIFLIFWMKMLGFEIPEKLRQKIVLIF